MDRIAKRTDLLLAAVMLTGLGLLAGCRPAPRGDYMTIDFQPRTPLRYRFVSSREVEILLTAGPDGKKEDAKTSTESIEMVMDISPVQIDPYGLSTLEFTCRDVRVSRTSFSGKGLAADAMESLKGKSYTIRVSPTGQVEELGTFETLLKEIGRKSFVSSASPDQNIKNPDMILDWIFFQYALWDVSASNPKPLAGIRQGSSWQSEQFMPWPAPIRNIPSRVTTYTVREISETDTRKTAVIDSRYQLREKPVLNFPMPYEGSFQIKGSLFSVLRNFRHESIEGSGTQVYNLTDGILQEDRQDYTLVTRADFILPLGQSLPTLTVRQSITIERLDNDPGQGQIGAAQ